MQAVNSPRTQQTKTQITQHETSSLTFYSLVFVNSWGVRRHVAFIYLVSGIEPNFEDLDLVVDQAQGEVVAVQQADPHSNNIHVAHNNPRDSDIMITQTNPFNTTIHISLNVGTGRKVSISAVVGL